MFRILALALLLLAPPPASAAVTITFYSHKFQLMDGIHIDFPHGFVVMQGATADGTPVNVHLGFSARNIFFDVLWRPVEGALDDEELTDAYVDDAIRHFAFPITDEQVRAVMAVEHEWRTWPQPSYEIDTHNCVTFVKEIAVAAGLAVSDNAKFIHAPGDFLEDVAVPMPPSPAAPPLPPRRARPTFPVSRTASSNFSVTPPDRRFPNDP